MTDHHGSPSPQELLTAGKEARLKDRFEEANALFELSLAAATKRDDRPAIAAALFALAENAICIANDETEHSFDKRRRLADEAQDACARIGDEQGIIRCLILKATVAPSRREQKELIDASAALAERIGYRQGIVGAKVRLAAYLSFDDRQQAAEMVAEAVMLAKEVGDEPCLIHALMAMTSFLEGPSAKRRAAFEELQAIYRANGQQKQLVNMLIWCSNLGCEDNDYDRKETYLTEALAVARAIGDVRDEASCLLNLSYTARGRGDSQQADRLEADSRSLWDIPTLPLPVAEDEGKKGIVDSLVSVIWGSPNTTALASAQVEGVEGDQAATRTAH